MKNEFNFSPNSYLGGMELALKKRNDLSLLVACQHISAGGVVVLGGFGVMNSVFLKPLLWL